MTDEEWFDATSIDDRNRGWTVETSMSGRWRYKRFRGGPWLSGRPPGPDSQCTVCVTADPNHYTDCDREDCPER